MPELRKLYQGQPTLTKQEGVPKAYRKNHVGGHYAQQVTTQG